MLPAINKISTSQSNPTDDTNNKLSILMDYAHTYHNTIICYCASGIRLHINSDAAYRVMLNAKSRGAGYVYLSNKPSIPVIPLVNPNGSILTQCTTTKRVMSSTVEAETDQVFNNTRAAIPIRRTLKEIHHPQQGPTYLKTDNKTSEGFTKSTIRKKHSKAWDMSFHWIKDCMKIDTYGYIGKKSAGTLLTTSPRITCRVIIKVCNPNMF